MTACDVLLLIAPNAARVRDASGQQGKGFIPPLGLGYLAAVLEAAGYTVAILDMDAQGLRRADLVRWLSENQPRVVGIGTMVGSYNNGLRAAQVVKQTCPAAWVVMGGPQATFLVQETLACPAVDVLVCGEGEETLLDLMACVDGSGRSLDSIPGIAFRDGDRIHQTETRPLIADLDSLPFPARHLFGLHRYTRPGVLITSRGCVGQCVFCASPAMYPRPRYRSRAPQRVVDEIEELVERFGIRDLFIADDAFTLQAKRAMAICDQIIARNIRVHWTCEARVDSMTPELVRRMREAGCTLVFYGVETGDPNTLPLVRKRITLERVEQAVDFTQAAGIDVMCSFIIGFPWDTRETIGRTIGFANRLRGMGASAPNRGGDDAGAVTATFYHLTPLPGTYIYEHATELGLRFMADNWDLYTMTGPIVETRHLNTTDMRALHLAAMRPARVGGGVCCDV